MPSAGYEPSSSETAKNTKAAWWEDPYARPTHTERRDPTTALRETHPAASVIRQAGLDGPWDFSLTLFGPIDLPYAVISPPTEGVLRPIPFSYPEMLAAFRGLRTWLRKT